MTWLSLLILLAAFALLWPLSLLFGWLADRYHALRERGLDDRILAELRSRILHGTSATWVGPRQQPEADMKRAYNQQEG